MTVDLREVMESGHKAWDLDYGEKFYRHKAVFFEREFGDLLKNTVKQARILDVGCGDGSLLYWLSKTGFTNVEGVDLGRDQVKQSQKVCKKVTLDSAISFLKKNKGFDIIFMVQFLEHLPKEQVPDVLTYAFKSLNPKGNLIVSVPNVTNPFSNPHVFGSYSHFSFFTQGQLQELFRLAGFKKFLARDCRVHGQGLKRLAASFGRSVLHSFLKVGFMAQGMGWRHLLAHDLVVWGIKSEDTRSRRAPGILNRKI